MGKMNAFNNVNVEKLKKHVGSVSKTVKIDVFFIIK